MNSLADNIVVHQTNQQLNNKYDTNFYAGKVKEIESPEKITELFNLKEAHKYRINLDEEDGEIFYFVKVATINPDVTSAATSRNNYESIQSPQCLTETNLSDL